MWSDHRDLYRDKEFFLGGWGGPGSLCSGRGHHRELDPEKTAQEVRSERLLVFAGKDVQGARTGHTSRRRRGFSSAPSSPENPPANGTSGQRRPRDSDASPCELGRRYRRLLTVALSLGFNPWQTGCWSRFLCAVSRRSQEMHTRAPSFPQPCSNCGV